MGFCLMPYRHEISVQIWNAGGTCDKLFLGGLRSIDVVAQLIRSFVDACQVLDSERSADPRLFARPLQAVDALVSSLRRRAAWQIKDSNEIGPAQRRLIACRWWNAGGAAGDVVAPGGDVWPSGADGVGRGSADRWPLSGRGVGKKAGGEGVIPPLAKRCPSWPQRWVPPAASRRVLTHSGGFGVACPTRLPNVLGSSLNRFFPMPAVLASEVGYTGQKRSARYDMFPIPW